MSEVTQEIRCCYVCQQQLAKHGVHDRACTMVLFAMVQEGISYVEAVKAWAEYETPGGWDAHRWHSEICYVLLRAWVDEAPGVFFDKMVEEVLARAH